MLEVAERILMLRRHAALAGPAGGVSWPKFCDALLYSRNPAMLLGSMEPTFLTIQSRGTLALPPELRQRHGLDEPGAQVEVIERDDGVIELRPFVAVPRTNLVILDEADSAFFAEAVLADPPRSEPRPRARHRRQRPDVSKSA